MSLLGEPAPDFSDPLALLAACHQRMLGLCDLLERLPAWINAHGVDDEAVTGARRVRHYFETAARLHHRDEEQDLFPLLHHDPALARLITELCREHAQLEDMWQPLAERLEQMEQQGSAPTGLEQAIAPFCSAYRRHIERENGELLPRAGTLLSAQQCATLGARMAARRGQDAD